MIIGVRATVSIVPRVASTIISPQTQPKKTVEKADVEMLPNAIRAPTPNKPETKLAPKTPTINQVIQVLRSSTDA